MSNNLISQVIGRVGLKIDKIVRSDEKVVNQYFENEAVQNNLSQLSQFLHKRFGSRWITAAQIAKQQNVIKTEGEAIALLNLMCTGGYALSQQKSGVIQYQITLTPQTKLRALKSMLSEAEMHCAKIKAEIAAIEKDLSKKV